MGSAPTIRPYRPSDRAAVYEICVRTGDAGGDVTGRFTDDELLPDLFAGPYLALEPEQAFVLDDGHRVVGYVVGTADTGRFVTRYRSAWLPRVVDRYPAPSDQAASDEEELIAQLHHPERMIVPELAAYPAHIHIDLLPRAQGHGHGRALLSTSLHALAAAGAPALHVGVADENPGARRFYDRLGFHEVPVAGAGDTVYLGRATGSG